MTTVAVNRTLAIGAVILGLLAALVGSRPAGSSRAVDPVTLAEWIRARGRIDVIDLRDAAHFDQLHVPTARNIGPDGVPALTFPQGDTVVLVDDGAGRAAGLAAELDGVTTFRWLEGGVPAWVRELLNPTIAEDASDSAFAAFRRTAELSRYFGGLPRVVPPGAADGPRDDAEATVRRGCGF